VPALQIRGKNYIRDKKKIPAQPCAFQLVEVCGYNTAKGQDQRFSTERDDSYYARARSMGRKKFVFVSAALDLAKQQDVHALYACCRGWRQLWLQVMHFDLGATHTVMVYELHGEVFEKDPVLSLL